MPGHDVPLTPGQGQSEVCLFCHSVPTWPVTRNPVRAPVVIEAERPSGDGEETPPIA
jgi:hypothetical protein